MRVLLFLSLILLLVSCRKEEEAAKKTCDCTLQYFSRSLTYKDDGKALRRIDSTAWNKFNSEYYSSDCDDDKIVTYRNGTSVKYNKDGTITMLEEKRVVTCK
ncbi:hypothetical protein NNL19_02935 [Riemerella anatipestifer]|uniref:hypothetical protein n=1 Tax=Riemerella anatipestifer TaxID=34085 RepID=UPI0012ADC2F2|nr:hypothetical protein [Riemerella anatipestifer]MCQ4154554.1 hypothetical protein [Riemerella anatipestifer]MCQ4180547.1 hypothetical protein [Riemerella anatipestifer]MDR7793423.1 hypothetical protein [Riemerella anatipestifer]MRQ21852.1 hypothetical protein [Riemerella anatipestifer]